MDPLWDCGKLYNELRNTCWQIRQVWRSAHPIVQETRFIVMRIPCRPYHEGYVNAFLMKLEARACWWCLLPRIVRPAV